MGAERFFAVRADHHCRAFHRIPLQGGIGGIHKNDGAGLGQVLAGTEGHGAVDVFGGAIDPGALGTIEGQFFPVHGKKVLAEEFADVFEQITKAADDRVITTDGLLGLIAVDDVHHQHHGRHGTDGENKKRGHQFQGGE